MELSLQEWAKYKKYMEKCSQEFMDKKQEEHDKKIKVGDKVKIVDKGFCYSAYSEWVYNNVHGQMKCRFAFGEECYDGAIGEVIAVGNHLEKEDLELVYFQDESGQCFLFGIEGLQKLKED